MAEKDLDLHAGLDGLLGDMSNHQRRVGEVPTAEENRKLATELIEKMDREETDAKPATVARPAPPPTEANHSAPNAVGGLERKEGQHGRYLMGKSLVDDTRMRKSNEAEHWFMSHAMPRAMLLLEKRETGPLGQASWRDRTLAVMELHTRVSSYRVANRLAEARMLERRFMHEFLELLEASSATFGDWKKDASLRVSASG